MKKLFYQFELFLIRHRELSNSIINSTFVMVAAILGILFASSNEDKRFSVEKARIKFSEIPPVFSAIEICPREIANQLFLYIDAIERIKINGAKSVLSNDLNSKRDELKVIIDGCITNIHKLSLVLSAIDEFSLAEKINKEMLRLVEFQAVVDTKRAYPWDDQRLPLEYFDDELDTFKIPFRSTLNSIRLDLIKTN